MHHNTHTRQRAPYVFTHTHPDSRHSRIQVVDTTHAPQHTPYMYFMVRRARLGLPTSWPAHHAHDPNSSNNNDNNIAHTSNNSCTSTFAPCQSERERGRARGGWRGSGYNERCPPTTCFTHQPVWIPRAKERTDCPPPPIPIIGITTTPLHKQAPPVTTCVTRCCSNLSSATTPPSRAATCVDADSTQATLQEAQENRGRTFFPKPLIIPGLATQHTTHNAPWRGLASLGRSGGCQ